MEKNKRIPKEARENIELLTKCYKEVEELETCDLVHIYDTKIYGATQHGGSYNGYVDARMFTVWCFNFKDRQKCKLENKDQLYLGDIVVDIVRIFADGSTMIRFKGTAKIGFGQSLDFEPVK